MKKIRIRIANNVDVTNVFSASIRGGHFQRLLAFGDRVELGI
jgi:hypothetical protein